MGKFKLFERVSGLIIREHDIAFVMIEQNHHAHISAAMMEKWQDSLFDSDPLYTSVLFAIEQHDCGWRFFDEQPFWNDAIQAPYDFTNFPVAPKTVLYTKGIDEVEKHDAYAAALCSAHYHKFMENNDNEVAKEFIKQEANRRSRTMATMDHESLRNFDKHLALLQFADNISLYMCLNEPGVDKEKEHFFFKNGIPVSNILQDSLSDVVHAEWRGEQMIALEGLPSIPPFSVTLQQKFIKKQDMHDHGLLEAYRKDPYMKNKIQFQVL